MTNDFKQAIEEVFHLREIKTRILDLVRVSPSRKLAEELEKTEYKKAFEQGIEEGRNKKADFDKFINEVLYGDQQNNVKKMDNFWKELGAYETENNKMYLDFDGIRLVIADGKIEGWYIP